MSVVATAAIKVTADTKDLKKNLGEAEAQTRKFAGSHLTLIKGADGSKLALDRMRGALTSFASQATRTHPVVGALAGSIGQFAVGTPMVAAALLGIAALAKAYDLITSGARKAKEENDKLVDSLLNRFKPKTGKGSDVLKEYEAALKQQRDAMRHLRMLQSSGSDAEVARKYSAAGEAAPFLTRDKEIERVTKELAEANEAIRRAQAGSVTSLQTVTTTARDMTKVASDAAKAFEDQAQAAIGIFDSLASHGQSSSVVNAALVAAYRSVSNQIREMGDVATPARAKLLDLRDALAANLVVSREIARVNSTGTVGPLAGKTLPGMSLTDGGLAGAQAAMRGHTPNVGGIEPIADVESAIDRQAAKDARNAEMIRGAIINSAQIIGNFISNALNVGGGGKGSQLGGALGGTAGTVAGMIIGSAGGPLGTAIGGVIGSTIGSIAGSFFGGLFDNHKKAVDKNTVALNQLTNALYNGPMGFKVEYARYGASDARRIYEATSTEAVNRSRRGGAQLLGVAA